MDEIKEQAQSGAASVPGGPDAEDAVKDETTLERGLVALVRGDQVNVRQSMAGLVTSRGGAEFRQGMAGALVSGGETHLRQGMAVALPSLGDVHMHQAGAQWVLSAGDVNIEKGGCGAAVAPSVSVHNGVVGVAAGWKIDLGEGARVLFTTRTAAVAGVAMGVAFGIAAGLSAAAGGARLMRRRG